MISKFLDKIRHLQFFTRVLLYSFSLLLLFAFISCIVITSLSNGYEESQYYRQYDLACVSLEEAYSTHLHSYTILAGHFLTADNRCDANLLALMEEDSPESLSFTEKTAIRETFRELCNYLPHLKGFLTYSEVNHNLYYYTTSKPYLSYAGSFDDTFGLEAYSGKAVGTDTMMTLLSYCNLQEALGDCYGSTVTMYSSPGKSLGFIIPIYTASEYDNILAKYGTEENSVFVIEDGDGNIIYHSNPDLNTDLYTSTSMHSSRYDFSVRYLLPRFQPKSGVSRYMILLVVIITLFSILLIWSSNLLIRRNITLITEGMNQFSTDRLDYRIPVPDTSSEFRDIIIAFNSMCEELQTSVNRSYIYELEQQKSELYALQTSINPHFLYNTLEIIRAQLLAGKTEDSSQMILLLSRIYRRLVNARMFVSMENEIELCENFMELYQYRFQNFDYEFITDDDVLQYGLPQNTLQPLLENYFVHGLDASRQDNRIEIETSTEKQAGTLYLSISVSNNGKPLEEAQAELLRRKLEGRAEQVGQSGFALTNVFHRLQIVFGENCSIKIDQGAEDMSFRVRILFPALSVAHIRERFGPGTLSSRLPESNPSVLYKEK